MLSLCLWYLLCDSWLVGSEISHVISQRVRGSRSHAEKPRGGSHDDLQSAYRNALLPARTLAKSELTVCTVFFSSEGCEYNDFPHSAMACCVHQCVYAFHARNSDQHQTCPTPLHYCIQVFSHSYRLIMGAGTRLPFIPPHNLDLTNTCVRPITISHRLTNCKKFAGLGRIKDWESYFGFEHGSAYIASPS